MSASEEPRTEYEAPPRARTTRGDLRRVGLELEFAHVSVEEATRIVARVLGGRITYESPSIGEVEGTPFGNFHVEIDSLPLKERRYLEPLEKLGLDAEGAAAQTLEEAVVRVAREIVPVEIVTAPIPWNELAGLDPLWAALRDFGAQDTHASVLYAFGLHMNPELPDLEAMTTVTYLRSYFLMEPWIRNRTRVDVSRWLAPFVHGFPEIYRQRVIDPRYTPNWPTFVADYVEANPTRNRTVDLLPLILHVCRRDLSDRVDNWPKVKPRPAFHYRLPNSELSRPGWTPASDWNRWVLVERLASDAALLHELATEYMRRSYPIPSEPDGWVERIEELVRARLGSSSSGS
jgi:hypothetical protein